MRTRHPETTADEAYSPSPGNKGKRAARTVLTGMCYSVGSATRQGSSSLTRFTGQSAMTSFLLVDVTVIPDDEIAGHHSMAALTLLQKHIHRRAIAASAPGPPHQSTHRG
ncbi:hypothetical protein DQY68_20575 [Salmonella enterica subsp. salamae]|nr:hypothetical protein [Salmonella enterica subsp. salamae]